MYLDRVITFSTNFFTWYRKTQIFVLEPNNMQVRTITHPNVMYIFHQIHRRLVPLSLKNPSLWVAVSNYLIFKNSFYMFFFGWIIHFICYLRRIHSSTQNLNLFTPRTSPTCVGIFDPFQSNWLLLGLLSLSPIKANVR